MFKCNCPHEVRAGCSEPACPHYVPPHQQSPKLDCLVEYLHRDVSDIEFWLDIHVDRQPWAQLGPFDSAASRHAAKADMLNMMRTMGAKDLPTQPQ